MAFRPSLRWGVGLSGALVALGGAGSAQADALTQKADSFLQAGRCTRGWSTVIVRAPGGWDAAREAKLKSLGGYVYRHRGVIESVAARVPSRNLVRLASLPFVTRLSADVDVKKNDEFTVQHTGADLAWQDDEVDGAGVGVAVIDSGVNSADHLANGLYSPATLERVAVEAGAGEVVEDRARLLEIQIGP